MVSGPGSSTVAVDESCGELQRFSPSSLLVESLIEQLCKLIEKDANDQKQLYLSKYYFIYFVVYKQSHAAPNTAHNQNTPLIKDL